MDTPKKFDMTDEAFNLAQQHGALIEQLAEYRHRAAAFVTRMTDEPVEADREQVKREAIYKHREHIEQLDVALAALSGRMLDGQQLMALLSESVERHMTQASEDLRYDATGKPCLLLDSVIGMLRSLNANLAQGLAGRVVKL